MELFAVVYICYIVIVFTITLVYIFLSGRIARNLAARFLVNAKGEDQPPDPRTNGLESQPSAQPFHPNAPPKAFHDVELQQQNPHASGAPVAEGVQSARTARSGKSKAAAKLQKGGPVAEGRKAQRNDDTAKLNIGPDSTAHDDDNPFQNVDLNDPQGLTIQPPAGATTAAGPAQPIAPYPTVQNPYLNQEDQNGSRAANGGGYHLSTGQSSELQQMASGGVGGYVPSAQQTRGTDSWDDWWFGILCMEGLPWEWKGQAGVQRAQKTMAWFNVVYSWLYVVSAIILVSYLRDVSKINDLQDQELHELESYIYYYSDNLQEKVDYIEYKEKQQVTLDGELFFYQVDDDYEDFLHLVRKLYSNVNRYVDQFEYLRRHIIYCGICGSLALIHLGLTTLLTIIVYRKSSLNPSCRVQLLTPILGFDLAPRGALAKGQVAFQQADARAMLLHQMKWIGNLRMVFSLWMVIGLTFVQVRLSNALEASRTVQSLSNLTFKYLEADKYRDDITSDLQKFIFVFYITFLLWALWEVRQTLAICYTNALLDGTRQHVYTWLQLREGEGGFKSAFSPDTFVLVGTWEKSKEVWGRNPWLTGLSFTFNFNHVNIQRRREEKFWEPFKKHMQIAGYEVPQIHQLLPNNNGKPLDHARDFFNVRQFRLERTDRL